MKALKEKRISLRSLWRRGLVILSLFALVFASCADSEPETGGNVSVGPGDVKGISIVVTKLPATQYYGRPVDLEGIEATVTYSDGTTKTVSGKDKFSAYPRIVTGQYDYTGTLTDKIMFEPMKEVLITCLEGGAGYYKLNPAKVLGIKRSNTLNIDDPVYSPWEPAKPDVDIIIPGLYELGVQVTGIESLRKTPVYVDDDPTKIGLGGVVINANYEDGDTKQIYLNDLHLRIVPDYARPNADGTYQGWLYITVGKNNLNWMDRDTPAQLPPNDKWRGGITYPAILEKVYTVVEGGLEYVEDEKPFIFFWEENTSAAWYSRLKDKSIKVTYTGDGGTKTLPISAMAAQRIWYNTNPSDASDGAGTGTVAPGAPADPATAWKDFYVDPIRPGTYTNKKTQPTVEIYYRGASLYQPVNVLTKLVGIAVEPGDLDPFDLLNETGRDNDVPYSGAATEEKLGGLIEKLGVKATYSAYNDAQVQKTIDLEYQDSAAVTKDGAYFTITNYTTVSTAAWNKLKPGVANVVSAVSLSHTVSGTAVDALLTSISGFPAAQPTPLPPNNTTTTGITGDQTKAIKQNVTWVKIRK